MRRFNAAKASVDRLREQGWVADIVERRNRFGSLDYLGFGDIVAIRRGHKPLIVQATMEGKVKDRADKMLALPLLKAWLDAEGLVEVWGWGKVKRVRGGKAFKWDVKRVRQITEDDLNGAGSEAMPGGAGNVPAVAGGVEAPGGG